MYNGLYPRRKWWEVESKLDWMPYFANRATPQVLRHERVYSVVRSLPWLAPAHVIATVLLAALYGRSCHVFLLITEPCTLSAIYLFIFLRFQHIFSPPCQQPASAKDEIICCISSFSLGLACGVIPASLLPDANTGQLLIMGGVDGALMAASTLASNFPQAALAFLCPVCGGVVWGTFKRVDVTSGTICFGSVLFALMLCGQVIHSYRRQKAAVISKLALNEQQQVMATLLNQVEETSTAWLWETDERGCAMSVPNRLAQVAHVDKEALKRISLLDMLEDALASSSCDNAGQRQVVDAFRTGQPVRNAVFALDFGGGEFWVRYSANPRFDVEGRPIGFVGVGCDITSRKEADEQVKYLADHDELTGLPNRRAFLAELDNLCRSRKEFCLLYADLDRFKPINDKFGHSVGDHVLRAVSKRLEFSVRAGDLVARIGGDEFAILLPLTGVVEGHSIARRIIAKVAEPSQVDTISFDIAISIGIAATTKYISESATLIRHADTALYEAKSAGGNCARTYTFYVGVGGVGDIRHHEK